MLTSENILVDLSVSLYNSIKFFFTYFASLLLSMHLGLLCLGRLACYHCIICLSLSLLIFFTLRSTLTNIDVATPTFF